MTANLNSLTNFDNFANLMGAVFTETNRDDLIAETAQAIFASVYKLHGMDFFARDIAPAQIKFDRGAYLQVLDTRSMPFFRAIKVLRKDDPELYHGYELNPSILPPLTNSIDGILITEGFARARLTEISMEDILDDFGAEKIDVWYLAGESIMIKSSTCLQYLLAGFYRWPNLDIQNFSVDKWTDDPTSTCPNFHTWIARQHPYAIIYDAASSVLQKIGMTDAARKYDNTDPRNPGLVFSQMQNLLISNILNTGR